MGIEYRVLAIGGAVGLTVFLAMDWENLASLFEDRPKFGANLVPVSDTPSPQAAQGPSASLQRMYAGMERINDNQATFRADAAAVSADMTCFEGLMTDVDNAQERIIGATKFLEAGGGTLDENEQARMTIIDAKAEIDSKMGNASYVQRGHELLRIRHKLSTSCPLRLL